MGCKYRLGYFFGFHSRASRCASAIWALLPVDKNGDKLSDMLSSPVVTRYLIDVQQHSAGKEAEALEREKERL